MFDIKNVHTDSVWGEFFFSKCKTSFINLMKHTYKQSYSVL